MTDILLFKRLTMLPTLPYDVLRTLLQTAARADLCTATNLAVLSRTIQPWIEEIIYSDVILSRQTTANAFLRTLATSKSKYPGFFANSVKSLFICPDVDPLDVVTILSTCRGVVNLSYWPLKHATTGGASRVRNGPVHDPWDSRTRLASPPRLSPPLVHRHQQRRQRTNLKSPSAVATHNIHHLSPRKLSLLVDEAHPIQCFQPTFDVPFFHNVSHLTVVNKWEDWSSWAGHSISEMAMPHLTHVKFDMSVGQAPPEDSRMRWRNTVTDGWSSAASEESCSSTGRASTAAEEAQSAWTRKITRVARALTDVLNNSRGLEICVLVLRFDSNPARTARQISRLVSAMTNEHRFSSIGHSHGMDGGLQHPDESSGFDPRLVFAWEKEPFRYSHAHSAHELMIWRAAEAVAKAQSYMSGYTVLNCDYLV